MDRRQFLKLSGITVASALLADNLLTSCVKPDNGGGKPTPSPIEPATGHFSIMQISSRTPYNSYPDNIGNSYILKTRGGKVIMMDGGVKGDAENLRKVIKSYGGTVHQWWLTHPHSDHLGAMLDILRNPDGIVVEEVYHSRFPDALLNTESGSATAARALYEILDNSKTINTTNLTNPGALYDVDGVMIKVLGVTNPELTMTQNDTSPYNNSSIILRVWDDTKSFIFLGDAQEECGDKLLLNSRFSRYLTCDYLQLAHHGQQGVKESFYKFVSFKYALWPTPSWVFNPPASSKLQTERTKEWLRKKGITDDKWIVSCKIKDWYLE